MNGRKSNVIRTLSVPCDVKLHAPPFFDFSSTIVTIIQPAHGLLEF